MAWSDGLNLFGVISPLSTIALIITIVLVAALFYRHLSRPLPPTQIKPKPKKVKNIVVRIQDVPASKSLDELKNDLKSLAEADPSLETTVNGIDRLTLARINEDDACATAVLPTLLSQSDLPRKLDEASREAGFSYIFDCDFFGITPLTDYDGAEGVDIITVPGLASHPIGSWKSSKPGNNKVWLRDFLPRDIPNARILLYGYDTKLLQSDSRQTIEDMSIMLLNLLSSFRTGTQSKRRPIIFAGHSLGGLLVKECLLQAQKRQNYESHHAIYQACCGLLLFGVPSHGLNNSQLLSIVQNQANESLIRDLILDKHLEPSMLLKRISTDFSERWGNHSPVICFYETRLSPTVQMLSDGCLEKSGPGVSMVTTQSATASVVEGGEPAVPFNVDHSGLVKFDSRSHELYVVVLDRLKTLVAGASVHMRKRSPDNLSPGEQRVWSSMNDPPFSAFRNSAKLAKPERGTLEWLICEEEDGKSHNKGCDLKCVSHSQTEQILRSDDFKCWRDALKPSSLLITAPPGSGKSVLSSFILQHLETDLSTDAKVIYYFCSIRTDEATPNAKSVLRSLVVQLCEAQATLFRLLPSDWTDSQSFKAATVSKLIDVFDQLLRQKQFTRIYCVIDGLDVYQDPEMIDIVAGMRRICESDTTTSRTSLHLLCTSRPIRQLLDAWGPSDWRKLRCNEKDITTFIEQRVSRLGFNFSEGLKSFIISGLLSRSEQSFLWLDVVVRRIENLDLPTEIDVTQEIQSSSYDLDELYSYLIRRAARRNGKVSRILTMVLYAKRPLRCEELQHAIAIDVVPITNNQSYREFLKDVALLNSRSITQILGTLLDVVDGEVLAIHQSLKDYFQRNGEFLSLPLGISPKLYPAYVLMRYLCLDYENRSLGDFPLFEYAASYWHQHVTSDDEIYTHYPLQDVLKYLLSSDPGKSYLTRKADLLSVKMAQLTFARSAGTIAVHYDIGWLTKIILDGQIAGLSTYLNSNSVLKAIEGRRASVMRVLLLYGTKDTAPLSPDMVYGICQHYETDMIKLLLDHRGDEVHITSRLLSIAASHWVWGDGDSATKLLLDKYGEDVEITSDILGAAAEFGAESTVRMLLSKANGKVEITTAILEKAASNDKEIFGLLLSQSEGKVEITEQMLINALCSSYFQDTQQLEILLKERGKSVCITEAVLIAVMENITDAPGVLKLLFDIHNWEITITEGVLVAAVSASAEAVDMLFRERNHEIRITEAVLIAAIKNEDEPQKVMELLFTKRDDEIHITEAMVIAAIQNEGEPESILEVLFRNRDHEIHITESVLIAAIQNRYAAENILDLLFKKRNHEIHITSRVLAEAARANGKDVLMKLFLQRPSQESYLDSEVVLAAASNIKSTSPLRQICEILGGMIETTPEILCGAAKSRVGGKMLHLIFEKSPGPISIPSEAFTAAAASPWRTGALQFLLNAGPDKHAVTEETLLAAVGGRDSLVVLQALVRYGANNIEVTPKLALAAAASRQAPVRQELVKFLLDIDEGVTQMIHGNQTMIATASKRGDFGMVDLLLERGANPDFAAPDRFTPLAYASDRGYSDVVQLLLEAGANPNIKLADGLSPLAVASRRGHYDTVRTLLRGGADPKAKIDYRWSPLILASSYGHDRVVELLLREGADHTARTEDGDTMLSLACEQGNLKLVRLLLDISKVETIQDDNISANFSTRSTTEGARRDHSQLSLKLSNLSIGGKDNLGRTPTWYAAAHGYTSILELLLQHDSGDVDTEDYFGITPLSAAARGGRTGAVRTLLTSGLVNSKSQDCLGKSALWWANNQNYAIIAQLLSKEHDSSVGGNTVSPTEQEGPGISNLGYCDICLADVSSIEGDVYKCKFCAVRCFPLLCDSCIQKGGHCLNASHQLVPY